MRVFTANTVEDIMESTDRVGYRSAKKEIKYPYFHLVKTVRIKAGRKGSLQTFLCKILDKLGDLDLSVCLIARHGIKCTRRIKCLAWFVALHIGRNGKCAARWSQFELTWVDSATKEIKNPTLNSIFLSRTDTGN